MYGVGWTKQMERYKDYITRSKWTPGYKSIANIQNPGPKLAATTASTFPTIDSEDSETFEVGVFQTGTCSKALQSATAYMKTSCNNIFMAQKEATFLSVTMSPHPSLQMFHFICSHLASLSRDTTFNYISTQMIHSCIFQ